MDKVNLANAAIEARKNAHAPYSGFAVGAALLALDGSVYTGCNVENASYGATVCAERNAFSSAVADGAREFSAIAIAGGPKDGKLLEECVPCGGCRQVMAEFCDDDFMVILTDGAQYRIYTLGELYPHAFRPAQLKK